MAMAHREGNRYFAAAMTSRKARDIKLDFSFLPESNFHIEIFQDRVNADRNVTDYKRVERTFSQGDQLTVHLAPGVVWAARIYK